ncbi:MAG: hypothetical protein Kow00120_24920 [Anaerolineae bacterium]
MRPAQQTDPWLNLTPHAARLVARAVGLSAELGHHYLGVEHVILAALASDETAAGYAIEAAGLPAVDFVRALREEIAVYPRLPSDDDALPLTPRLARILERGSPDAPLDPTALLRHILADARAVPYRLTAALGGDPARLAGALADMLQVLEQPVETAAPHDDAQSIKDSMVLAARGRQMLQDLADELRDHGYELLFDGAVIGWLLVQELDSEGHGVIDRLFAEDIRPRVAAALDANPPGSVFYLSLVGDRLELLVNREPEP